MGRSYDPGNAGPSVRVARSVAGGVVDEGREGHVTAITTSLKTWLSWLKVNLKYEDLLLSR